MALLELVSLADVSDAYPRELSGGMKMRVSDCARARDEPATASNGRAIRRTWTKCPATI